MLLSLKSLLSSIVDYAGLFPPAQLSLVDALLIYDRARSSPQYWLLGPFVISAARLPELVELLPMLSGAASCPLSVILSRNWFAELEQVRQLQMAHSQLLIQAMEAAPLPPDQIPLVCQQLPAEVTAFFEIPFGIELEPFCKGLQQFGAAAKLRTGGITRESFPNSRQLCQRMLDLAEAQIPFKATAGLHHPLRGERPLTTQPESEVVTMHGFLNVLILAAFANQGAISLEAGVTLLEERSLDAFQLTDTTIRWRDYSLELSKIDQARRQCFRSFGSCSIQEPIDDLHALGLL